MLWIIAESGKLEKTKVRHNLVGVRSLEGLDALGKLVLEGHNSKKELILKFIYEKVYGVWTQLFVPQH